MDTDETYLNDEFFVVMAGDLPPDDVVDARRESHRKRIEDPDSPLVGPAEYEPSPAKEHYAGQPDLPVDGWVTFYDPDLLAAGEPFKHGTFPFRDHRSSESWFARPNAEKWNRGPVWKWQNPGEDPHESLTLSPSIGLGGGEITFHCYIRNGEIDWL